MSNIDRALAGAMSDPSLNEVVRQYFNPRPVATTFLGSKKSDAPVAATSDRDAVSATLDQFVRHGLVLANRGRDRRHPDHAAGDNLHLVFVEKTIATGDVVPIQMLWSNAAGGPGEPF